MADLRWFSVEGANWNLKKFKRDAVSCISTFFCKNYYIKTNIKGDYL